VQKNKYSVYCFFISVCIFSLFSCIQQNTTTPPFELYFDFAEEAKRLSKINPFVEKTVIKNGIRETRFDTINWEKELKIFSDCDINKARYKSSYKIDKIEAQSSVIVKYSSLDSSLSVKQAEFVFDEGNCTNVYIKKTEQNEFSVSETHLYYKPGHSYGVINRQLVKLAVSDSFEIRGRLFSYPEGPWRAEMDLGETQLPFTFEITNTSMPEVIFINSSEKITAKEVLLTDDSLIVKMPYFQSEFFLAINNTQKTMTGVWKNYSKGADYKIPVKAEFGKSFRFFESSKNTSVNISGKWETTFSLNTKDEYKAIGVFEQNGHLLNGTFLTETGDYRYLEGTVNNNKLFLSCFDGSHAFLFTADIINNETISNGKFWSGIHHKEPWVAVKNENAKLTHPDSLTFLKPGFSKFDFRIPDTDSIVTSLNNEKYKNKAVIVQIFGSWCPNCIDETIYLAELYEKYKKSDLKIVALAFERSDSFSGAVSNVKRMKKQTGAAYDFLIAGATSKTKASEVLPMLNHVMSFPTTIFIDKKGEVRKIHTGFYGPGTGKYYQKYTGEIEAFVNRLLNEN
jgi:thiol-disulfide isomerase/thioredoxin